MLNFCRKQKICWFLNNCQPPLVVFFFFFIYLHFSFRLWSVPWSARPQVSTAMLENTTLLQKWPQKDLNHPKITGFTLWWDWRLEQRQGRERARATSTSVGVCVEPDGWRTQQNPKWLVLAPKWGGFLSVVGASVCPMWGQDGLSHQSWFDGMGGGCVRGDVEINVSLSKMYFIFILNMCVLHLFCVFHVFCTFMYKFVYI